MSGSLPDPHGSGLWLGSRPLVLASGSRTRAELLIACGLEPEVIRPDVDERRLEKEFLFSSPVDLARRLAGAKAQEVARRHPNRVVIGADQVLEIDGCMLHKPIDLDGARSQLLRLSGRRHALHSAVALVSDHRTDVFHETAQLTMRSLGESGISAYLRLAGEARVTSSVGGYQLEGAGIHLFERVEGDQTTILGLPILPLLSRLRALNLLAIT